MAENKESNERKINMEDKGNYNERIEGNYIQGNIYYNQKSTNKYINKIPIMLFCITVISISVYSVAKTNNSDVEQVKSAETVDEAAIKLSNSHPFYKTSLIKDISQLKDISSTDWFYEDLRKLVEYYGIVYPFKDMTFRPNKTITKAELVDFEARAYSKFNKLIESAKERNYSCRDTVIGIPTYSVVLPPDVDSNDWYYESYKSIASITVNDYLISNNSFRGDEIVYKGEMAVFVNRFLNGLERILASSFNASNSNLRTAYETSSKKKYFSKNISYINIISIDRIKDVSPSDWYYEDLRVLVDRYGALSYLPDQKFRGNQPASRAEVFALMSSSLSQMEKLLNTIEDCQYY